jgi:hypothetical protein
VFDRGHDRQSISTRKWPAQTDAVEAMQLVATQPAVAVVSATRVLVRGIDETVDCPVLNPVAYWHAATCVTDAVLRFQLELVSDRGINIRNPMTVDEHRHLAPCPFAIQPESGPRQRRVAASLSKSNMVVSGA